MLVIYGLNVKSSSNTASPELNSCVTPRRAVPAGLTTAPVWLGLSMKTVLY